MTATAPFRKPALPALSGLRTVLAVNVMFFHFTPPHPRFLTPVIDNAYVFVGFFFLISGFVMGYNYADRPALSRRQFYLARISRVYPTYLLVLLFSLPFLTQEWQAHTHNKFYLGLLLTPLALQGWVPSLATFWNTVGWTVPAEFLLYAIFPFLLLFFARRARWLRSPWRIVTAILTLWAIGILPHIAYLSTNPDHLPGPATRYTYAIVLRFIKYDPLMYVCSFSVGILLARLHAMLALAPWKRALVALTALALLALFFAFGVQRIPYVIIHGALLLPIFSALLIGLAGPNWVAGVFSFKPILWLGETTLALYLLHFNGFILIHYYKLPERLHVTRFDPWISFVFLMLLAVLVTRYYERPARRYFLALFTPTEEKPG